MTRSIKPFITNNAPLHKKTNKIKIEALQAKVIIDQIEQYKSYIKQFTRFFKPGESGSCEAYYVHPVLIKKALEKESLISHENTVFLKIAADKNLYCSIHIPDGSNFEYAIEIHNDYVSIPEYRLTNADIIKLMKALKIQYQASMPIKLTLIDIKRHLKMAKENQENLKDRNILLGLQEIKKITAWSQKNINSHANLIIE